MAARKQGEVKVRDWKAGRGYALRFRAYGERQYLTLGFEHEGWDPDKAEEELQNILADVRRGFWVPPRRRSRAGGATRASRDRGAGLRPLRRRPDRVARGPGRREHDQLRRMGAEPPAPVLRRLAAQPRSTSRRSTATATFKVTESDARRAGDRPPQAAAQRARADPAAAFGTVDQQNRSTSCSGCSRSRSNTGDFGIAENPAEG